MDHRAGSPAYSFGVLVSSTERKGAEFLLTFILETLVILLPSCGHHLPLGIIYLWVWQQRAEPQERILSIREVQFRKHCKEFSPVEKTMSCPN